MADLQACTLLCTLLCLPTLTAFLYQLPIDHTLKLQPYEPACPRARPPEPFYTDHILILPFSYQILRWQSCKPACPVHALLCLLTPVTSSFYLFVANILRWRSCKPACPRAHPSEPPYNDHILIPPFSYQHTQMAVLQACMPCTRPSVPPYTGHILIPPFPYQHTQMAVLQACMPCTHPPEPPYTDHILVLPFSYQHTQMAVLRACTPSYTPS